MEQTNLSCKCYLHYLEQLRYFCVLRLIFHLKERTEANITWTLDKRPLIIFFFWAKSSIKHHFIGVHTDRLHWASRGAFQALSFASVTGIVAPSTPRLLQTLSTGPQPRAVLSFSTWNTTLMHCFLNKMLGFYNR